VDTILGSMGVPTGVYAPVAILLALAGMLSLTGTCARLIDRYIPATETYRVARHDFAGCTGTLLLPASPIEGYAQVKDREGNVHNVQCRTARGELGKGEVILIVEYDEASQTYIVDAARK